MKVIKPGRKPEPFPREATCGKCDATLEIEQSDVQAAYETMYIKSKNSGFVFCPECGNRIIVSNVKM